MVITSRQNVKIKRIASLKEKKFRALYGEYTVEGIKMVGEALAAGLQVKEVVGVGKALSSLPRGCYRVTETDESVFSYISDTMTPQGVIAVVKLPENRAVPPKGSCAVLDGVSDPGNLGTIIRTCAALGLKDVYLVGCADPFSPKAVRASMSGIFFTEVHELGAAAAISMLEGKNVIAADMGGESVFGADITDEYALVVGNEANGVSDVFLNRADKIISIPMEQGVESLNVSAAFAVAAYALAFRNGKFNK